MKPIGPTLKKFIEEHGMVKMQVAKKVGISYNYLSTIFSKETLDAALLERLCVAVGLNPTSFFEYGKDGETVSYSDIKAKTTIGTAEVKINHNTADAERLLADKDRIIEEKNRRIEDKEKLIAEKERYIRILEKMNGIQNAPDTRHEN